MAIGVWKRAREGHAQARESRNAGTQALKNENTLVPASARPRPRFASNTTRATYMVFVHSFETFSILSLVREYRSDGCASVAATGRKRACQDHVQHALALSPHQILGAARRATAPLAEHL